MAERDGVRRLMRVITYVDGFNLYFGLKSKGWRKYYWLDLWALAERFLKNGQELKELVYCTSKVKNDQAAIGRQLTFLDALQAYRPNLKVVYGHFLSKTDNCRNCGHPWNRHEEKRTDVNIACNMLTDAMDDKFDIAFLISADSDLVPPVEIVRSRWPNKRVVAIFPPDRQSGELKRACQGQLWIGEDKLRQCQLPQLVPISGGNVASRPAHWA